MRDLFDLSIDEDNKKKPEVLLMAAIYKGDKGKNLSIKEYLNIIKPYLSDIINDHKSRGLIRYHSGNKSW